MHSMIMELCRDGYKNQIFSKTEGAVGNGRFINDGGEEKELKCMTK